MGLVDTIKRRYDLRQVDKYTKRRMSQSQFESRDRDYYNAIYVDGAYLQYEQGAGNVGTGGGKKNKNTLDSISSSDSAYRTEQQRWSLPSFLRRSFQQHNTSQSLATQQAKTSESYTLNG